MTSARGGNHDRRDPGHPRCLANGERAHAVDGSLTATRFDIGSEYLHPRRSAESPGRRRPVLGKPWVLGGSWGSEAHWVVCRPQRRLIVFWTTMKIVDS